MTINVHFITLGGRQVASSRVRAYNLAGDLSEHGVIASYSGGLSVRAWLLSAWRIVNSPIIVFQKRYSGRSVWLAKLAKLCGRKIVFDIDDAPSRKDVAAYHRAEAFARMADAVTAGSRELFDWIKPFNRDVVLVPSTVQLGNYVSTVSGRSSDNRELCIGWIGNGRDYAQDIEEILVPPLLQLSNRWPFRVKIVGAVGNAQLHALPAKYPNVKFELIDSIGWGSPSEVAANIDSFDIGVYPLRNTPFNRKKCGFKALEYMAMGKPVIASPIGVNKDIVQHDVSGYCVETEEEWMTALIRLAENPSMRTDFGAVGRRIVEAHYSSTVAARALANLFEKIGVRSPHA